jgi:hypothetical protein
LFKTKKNIKNPYCTCEPLLFVKDYNCVDKEYEKANEQSVVVRMWRCIFCWLGKIVSHDGLGTTCYLACGITIRSWNQH